MARGLEISKIGLQICSISILRQSYSLNMEFFTVKGFNAGISNNMDSSRDLVAQWADNVSQAFDVANIVTPNVGTTYSINREFFDMVDTKASVSLDKPSYDFKAGLSAELNAALSGIIDYDRLGNVLVDKLEGAKITAELDSDKAYSNVKGQMEKRVLKK